MRHFSSSHQLETSTTPPRESFLLAFNTQKFDESPLSVEHSAGFETTISSESTDAVASVLSQHSTIISRPETLTEQDCRGILRGVLLGADQEFRIIQVHYDSSNGNLVFFLIRDHKHLITAKFSQCYFYLMPRCTLHLRSLNEDETVDLLFGDSLFPLTITYQNQSTIERYTLRHCHQDDDQFVCYLAQIETTI